MKRSRLRTLPIEDDVIINNVTKLRLDEGEKNLRIAFALRFNLLLDELEVTQLELSKRIGGKPSETSISFYRNGLREPNASNLRKIAVALNVSSDYLLGLAEIKSPDLTDISISNELGLNDGAIKGLRRFKEDYVLLNSPRLTAINYLLAQEQEFDLSVAQTPKTRTYDEVAENYAEWMESHPRVLSDIADYLLINTDGDKKIRITHDGLKYNSADKDLLETKGTTSTKEIIDSIYGKSILNNLKTAKLSLRSLQKSSSTK